MTRGAAPPVCSAWRSTSAELPRGIAVASTAAGAGHIFVAHADNFTTGVFWAVPDAGGDVQEWHELPPLPDGRVGPMLLVADQTLIALGGYDYDALVPVTAVDTAPILQDGGVGAWQPAVPLLQPRWLGSAALVNGQVILVDGDDPSGSNVAEIEGASLDETGAPSSWEAVGSAPAPHRNPLVTSIDGRVHVLGGDETFYTENAAWHAPLDGTGLPQEWSLSGVLTSYDSRCVHHSVSVLCLSSTSRLAGAGVISRVDFNVDGNLVETALAAHPLPATASGVVLLGDTVTFVGGYDETQPPELGGLLKRSLYADVHTLMRSRADAP